MDVSEEVIVVKKKFDSPYPIEESPGIYIHQPPYFLSYAKYLTLTTADIRSKLVTVARWIFGPTVGFGLTLLAKLPKNIQDIKTWEWISVLLGLLISGILYCFSRRKPNSKNDLLKDMDIYFKKHKERLWVGKNE